jgi:two-component system nitrogen regulation response regulator GlnG
VITAALEAEGFAVARCDSISERDRLLGEASFSALVTDVMLADGDGIETLDAVRRAHPALPVIVLSAQNTLDTAVRASIPGLSNFPKPFDIDELVRTVRQAAGGSSAARRGRMRARRGRACRWWADRARCRRCIA